MSKSIPGLYRRSDSKYWWYKFRPEKGGPLIQASTGEVDKKLAQAIFEKIRWEEKHLDKDKRPATISLKSLIDKYLQSCRNQRSYPSKKIHLQHIIDYITYLEKPDLLACQLTRGMVKEYRLWRLDSVKESTVNRELTPVRNMYYLAKEDFGLNLENPVADLKFFSEKKFRRDKHLSAEQKARLFPTLDPTLLELVTFAIQTGLRQGEMCNLKASDVNFHTGLIRVEAGEEDKTRFVPMTLEVRKILEDRLDGMGGKNKWVFTNSLGNKLSASGIMKMQFKRKCAEAGIDDFHWHDLRHTFASDFIMAGGDMRTLSEYMGHSVMTMTQRYSHLTPKYKAAQIALLPSASGYVSATVENFPKVEVNKVSEKS